MTSIYTLLVILIVLASFLMIGIVLIQESKGGGLSSQFSSSNSIMGVRKTTDIVEKTTWGLAIAMVIISVACAHVAPESTASQSVLERTTTESPAANPNNTPGFGAGKQAAPSGTTAPTQAVPTTETPAKTAQ